MVSSALLCIFTSSLLVLQQMQRFSAEDIESTTDRGDFCSLFSCLDRLCGICCCLGCYSESIILLDWTRYSCKSHINQSPFWHLIWTNIAFTIKPNSFIDFFDWVSLLLIHLIIILLHFCIALLILVNFYEVLGINGNTLILWIYTNI